MKDSERPVPFLLAGGNPNWVPRKPLMGLKHFARLDASSKIRQLLYPPTWKSHKNPRLEDFEDDGDVT